MAKTSKLSQALKSDPKLRAKFFTNLVEAAEEAGISAEELREDDSLSFLGDIGPSELPGGTQQIVIIHKSDSDKNSTSIIVGGKGLMQAMKLARELEK